MGTSIKMLRHQVPMLNVVAKILLKTISPSHKEIKEDNLKIKKEQFKLKSEVVTEYHKWLDIEDRYPSSVAPHLFPMWSYPSLYKLGKALNLPLHKVLNQGVKMIINDDLAQDAKLNTSIEIYKVQKFPSKTRINQRITTGTVLNPDALIAEIYAVILKDPKSILAKARVGKTIDTSKLTKVSSLYISKEDAQSYAYLTGDVNPIHLSKRIAKLMGLKGSIMHGFGLFALLYENLRAVGHSIKEIDVRFLNPVYLESSIHIYTAQVNDKKFSIKVVNKDHNMVHLSGEFSV